MGIEHLSASATADQIVAALVRDGGVIVDQLADPEIMDQAGRELDPYLKATPTGVDDFSGRHTRRSGALIARSETCRHLVMHPTVLGTVKNLLTDATSFQLHLTQIIAIGLTLLKCR